MTTVLDAATAISRAHTDFLLKLASTAQTAQQRWWELGSRVTTEATRTPTLDKTYWDEVAVTAQELRASGFNATQQAFGAWQAACTDAVRDVQPPFQDPAFLSLFQAWQPKPTEETKTVAKTKAAVANG